MRVFWIIMYLFFPFFTLAQTGIITGRVTAVDGKTPISLANVFLSNTTAGTTTNSQGDFVLRGLKPGQYTLIVSFIGYEDYSANVLVSSDPIKLSIKLANKTSELREVIISTPANWKKNYEWFVRDFIGTDENAKYCYVENPHILNFDYHKTQQELEAFTEEFLVVDNMALGYRVKFLVHEFTANKLTGIISNEGPRLFQDMQGSKKQIAEWHRKRDSAYYGSAMHFYRALYSFKLGEEGFQMMKLSRQLNPYRPPEEYIQQKIKKFDDGHHRDSIVYWIGMQNMSKYYRERLDRAPLPESSILFKTEKPGIFAVDFTDCLYILYTRKREQTDFRDIYRPLDMPNYQTTVLTIKAPYFFDTNGIVTGESSPLNEGTWAKSRLSDLLPFDYTPGAEPPVPPAD